MNVTSESSDAIEHFKLKRPLCAWGGHTGTVTLTMHVVMAISGASKYYAVTSDPHN